MNEKSNKVLTTFVMCFYLFALGSFGIRARWIFVVILILSTFTALTNGGFAIIRISKFKMNWYILYFVVAVLILLPNARHETDIYNYLMFVTITTYIITIAKTNSDEIDRITNLAIKMGLFFAIYVSFFRIFPNIYSATMYRFLEASVKETYSYGSRFGYGLPIGNGYTFADSAIWLGIAFLIAKDISEGERQTKYKIYLMIMVAGMLLEGRKSELVCAVITIVFMYYYCANHSKKVLGRRIFYIIIILTVGLIFLRKFGNSGLLQRFTIMIERIILARSGMSIDFSSGRFELWNIALTLFKENPIIGVGWGRFANYAGGSYRAVLDIEGLRNVHNILLQLLCETGIAGTILVSFPIISILSRLLKSAKQKAKASANDNYNKYTVFALGIMVYSVLLSFMDTNFYGQYFWCVFAMAVIVEDCSICTASNDK